MNEPSISIHDLLNTHEALNALHDADAVLTAWLAALENSNERRGEFLILESVAENIHRAVKLLESAATGLEAAP